MVLIEDYFNDILKTTIVKNAVDFNIRTHDRMIRYGEIPSQHSDNLDAYSSYPAIPSRRIIQSRSSHYPFLSKIYLNLPPRILFYIPKIESRFLSRSHSMDLVYQLASHCIFDFMRVNYKHLNNDIIPKGSLSPDKYHSMLKKYMPDYYYVYKATQFIKNFSSYNTVNNYNFNNYTVFYILILTVFILWPVYLDLYSIENGLVYVHSQYVKLIFLPDYIDFISSFLKEYTRGLYHLYFNAIHCNILTIQYTPVVITDFLPKFTTVMIYFHKAISYFDRPNLVHNFYWSNEASQLLLYIHYSIGVVYEYISIILVYPIKFYHSFMIHHIATIRNYYFILTLIVFILVMKHAAGGFNQVIKDYVGTKGGFMTSYIISSIVIFIFFHLLYLNVYKEEPEMITNILFLAENMLNLVISFFWFLVGAGKGMVLLLIYTYII